MSTVDVFLSPSVQEFNLGVGDYGTEEARMNQITDVVAYELERNGLTVARNSPEQKLSQWLPWSTPSRPAPTWPFTPTPWTEKPAVR